jgi:hypothetical protein
VHRLTSLPVIEDRWAQGTVITASSCANVIRALRPYHTATPSVFGAVTAPEPFDYFSFFSFQSFCGRATSARYFRIVLGMRPKRAGVEHPRIDSGKFIFPVITPGNAQILFSENPLGASFFKWVPLFWAA